MRLACQVLAAVAAAWCLWLVFASPPLTVSVRISEETETFGVDCASPVGGGAGARANGDGTVGRTWTIAEDEGIYIAVTANGDADRNLIEPGALDRACDARRDRRLGFAVFASLVVAGLLRAAVAFPPRSAPVPDRSGRPAG
jgi:hypothetical protein